jgi:hypothetical protein
MRLVQAIHRVQICLALMESRCAVREIASRTVTLLLACRHALRRGGSDDGLANWQKAY